MNMMMVMQMTITHESDVNDEEWWKWWNAEGAEPVVHQRTHEK